MGKVRAIIAASLLVMSCASTLAGDSRKPGVAAWRAGELEQFTRYNNTFDNDKGRGEGHKVIISGIQGALGVGAGLKVLEAGGSAADAALAAALAQITVQGGYGVSFAGFMTLTYYEAKTGRVHTLNAAYDTVRNEMEPLTIPGVGASTGRAVLVPGFMALYGDRKSVV